MKYILLDNGTNLLPIRILLEKATEYANLEFVDVHKAFDTAEHLLLQPRRKKRGQTLSPELCTAVLEDVLKYVYFKNRGIQTARDTIELQEMNRPQTKVICIQDPNIMR